MDDLLAPLERRLALIEDELAIQRLLASYGPLADAGLGQRAAALWTDDGAYDPGGVSRAEGRTALVEIYHGERHQSLIQRGSMHMTAPAQISLHGDRAEAVGYSVLALNAGNEFKLLRASINHWILARTEQGWRIVERVNRVLDGSAEAQALLEHADRS
ncbi:nuclear transport factor 2 family protein [uncultured Sphingomonas sp.]|uniref:nuclear transport factor 2 family protein n=1 Tax=uncultured Sphingomonas sp. TaxID=158754 RepID=UPI002637D987|nr:nuclear transport factor 2 family protein [uncultured Sphingomonas sp.]